MLVAIIPFSKEALEIPIGMEKVSFASYKEIKFLNNTNPYDSLTVLMVEFIDEFAFSSWGKLIDRNIDYILNRQDSEAIENGTLQYLIDISCILQENNNIINTENQLIQVPLNKLDCINYLQSLNSNINNVDHLLTLFKLSEKDELFPNFRVNLNENKEYYYNKGSYKIENLLSNQELDLKKIQLDQGGKIIDDMKLDAKLNENEAQYWKNDESASQIEKKNFKVFGYIICGMFWLFVLYGTFFKYLTSTEATIALILIFIGFFSLRR